VFLAEGVAVALEELEHGTIGSDDVQIVGIDLIAHHNELVDLLTGLDLPDDGAEGFIAALIEEGSSEEFQEIPA
jgi:hypothetical protein